MIDVLICLVQGSFCVLVQFDDVFAFVFLSIVCLAAKGLTSLLARALCFVTFPCGIPNHVWYLIVSVPDLCLPLYFGHF